MKPQEGATTTLCYYVFSFRNLDIHVARITIAQLTISASLGKYKHSTDIGSVLLYVNNSSYLICTLIQ